MPRRSLSTLAKQEHARRILMNGFRRGEVLGGSVFDEQQETHVQITLENEQTAEAVAPMGATRMDLKVDTHSPQQSEEKIHKKERKPRSDGDSTRDSKKSKKKGSDDDYEKKRTREDHKRTHKADKKKRKEAKKAKKHTLSEHDALETVPAHKASSSTRKSETDTTSIPQSEARDTSSRHTNKRNTRDEDDKDSKRSKRTKKRLKT